MTVIRPPITGDVQLDSWMNEVSNTVSSGFGVSVGAGASSLPGAGGNAVNAVTLLLYKRYSADSMPFAEEITVDTVYTYSTTTLTNSSTGSTVNFDGWYRSIPDLTQGDYLYAIQINIADRSNTEVISFDSWSSPTLISSANTAGIDGFNTATVTLFQRTTGAVPTNPQGTLTYTFADASYTRSVPNDGWTTLDNVGSGGVLWLSSAIAASRSGTFVIPATEWSTSRLSSNGIDGVDGIDGTNGVSTALLVVYKRSATTPTTPTGGSFNFTGAVLTAPTGWSVGIETGTDPVYVSRAIASVVGQTGTDSSIAWSPAELAFQNGLAGAPGSDGSQGSSFFEGLAFTRSATQPVTPTGGEFNFGTNVLTPPTGWYVDIPTGTDPAWMISGNFSVVGQTGIDNSTTWTVPTKAFDNGLDGTDGTDGVSVYLYNVFKRSPLPYTEALTGGSYNFTDNVGTPPTGWSNTVPSGSDDLYIATTTATISGPTGTDSSLTWTIPTTLSTNGIDGQDATDGRSTAVLNVYKRSATAITTAPTGGSFNFNNSNLTPPTTYSSSIPSGTDPVYVSTGLASVLGATGTDSTIPWSVPVLVFSNGEDGTSGKSLYEAYVFKRSSTEITIAPTGGSFDFGTNTLTPPTGWSDVPPPGTDALYISIALFSIVGQTGIDSSPVWSPPVLQAKSGTDGTNGQSVFKFSIYRRGPTLPAPPTGGSYDFGLNQITPPTNWYSTAPDADGNPLWTSTTTATVNGATGVDNTLTWAAVTKLVQDGVDGSDGTDGQDGAPGAPGAPGADGQDGTDGIDGTNGTDGAAGPRNTSGYLYYGLTATSPPATPTATAYLFQTGNFGGLTANWSRTPPAVSGGDAHYWATSYYVSEVTLGGSQVIAFSTPFSSFQFDGLVTFSNLNNELSDPNSAQLTTIDGGLLKTGTIDVGLVNVSGTSPSGLNVKSANSGERMEITSQTIKIFDATTLRVKIGKLT